MRDRPPWRERVRRWGPIFLAAVAVRIIYWAIVLPHWTPISDADQYDKIARSLADGTGYGLQFPQIVHHPTAFRPPLLPLLLTPGHWLFGEAMWPGRLLSVVLGSVVVVLAGVLAARIGGRRAGYLAALVVMFSPPLLANDTITLTEPLALLLGLAAILLLDEGRFLQAGLTTGLLLLTRPNGYLVVGILALWAWRKLGPRAAIGLVAVAACVLAPWMVRNRVQLGTWTVNTSDGFTLAAIYAPPAQAAQTAQTAQTAGIFTDPVLSPAFNSDEDVRLSQFNEGEWNALLTERAIAGLRNHPAYVLQVLASNVPAFFELDPSASIDAQRIDGRRLGLLPLTRPVFYVTSILGLVGLARYWRDHRVRVVAAITGQYVVLSLLLVAPPRLRAPFDLACSIGLGLLLASLWGAQRDRLGLRRGSGDLDRGPAEVAGIAAVGVASRALVPLRPGGVAGAEDPGCVSESGEPAGTGAGRTADEHRAGQVG